MKKLFSLLLLLALPLGVKAAGFTEKDAFYTGDSVNVALYDIDTDQPDNSANGNLFHVLKESKSGERTVTLIYDGTIEGSPTVYDESNPNDNSDATAVLEDALISQKINAVITNEAKPWNVESSRLLSAADLTYLGITQNSTGGYDIPSKYNFLNPIKLDGLLSASYYNYWTMIQDTSKQSTSVYCVELSEDGESASLVSKDITSITEGPECAIRPVVEVDKKFILCNNTPHETPKETPKNVKTGVEDYILPLAGIILIATSAIVVTRKKNLFKSF